MIIFHGDKRDENKVIGNACICVKVNSVTLPYSKVNTTKTKQYSI